MSAPPLFDTDIDEALAALNLALRTHGGSVECTGLAGNTIRLKMAGLCASCLFKPVTLAATIRPYIRARLGMDVEIEGARISDEAQARLERALTAEITSRRAAPTCVWYPPVTEERDEARSCLSAGRVGRRSIGLAQVRA